MDQRRADRILADLLTWPVARDERSRARAEQTFERRRNRRCKAQRRNTSNAIDEPRTGNAAARELCGRLRRAGVADVRAAVVMRERRAIRCERSPSLSARALTMRRGRAACVGGFDRAARTRDLHVRRPPAAEVPLPRDDMS